MQALSYMLISSMKLPDAAMYIPVQSIVKRKYRRAV